MRLGIFGGSFNPVHNGHLRLVVEAAEAMDLDRVDIIPAHIPPHKDSGDLLPFEFRLGLLRKVFRNLPWITVRDMEGQRQGPSYTYDTLSLYAEENSDAERFFLMGATDMLTLPSWYRGNELTDLAHLVALNRLDVEMDSVHAFINRFWPGAWLAKEQRRNATVWTIPRSGNVYYLTMSRLDISSSQIRRLWLEQKEIQGLAPETVADSLRKEREMVTKIWGSN